MIFILILNNSVILHFSLYIPWQTKHGLWGFLLFSTFPNSNTNSNTFEIQMHW